MKCRRGVTIHGATLRGGILAGDFKTVGIVSNQHSCVNSCCRNKRCDVALMLGKECFNVKCYSDSLCGLAPATSIFDEVTPIITYVRGHIRRKRSTGKLTYKKSAQSEPIKFCSNLANVPKECKALNSSCEGARFSKH